MTNHGSAWPAQQTDAAASPSMEGVFGKLTDAALATVEREPLLAPHLHRVLLGRSSLADALASLLGDKLGDRDVPEAALIPLVQQAVADEPGILAAVERDLTAIVERDPAASGALMPFLFFKGFQALQAHRIAHWLWGHGRRELAFHFQSRSSAVFAVDIHPAVRIGAGVLIDHGTSVVIGETAVVEDNVSILQEVTLGGTGKQCGDRHPKVREGVLIGAGAKILGNIEIGRGAKVGAGSVVLFPVPAFRTVVGVPARVVGLPHARLPAVSMDHMLPAETAPR